MEHRDHHPKHGGTFFMAADAFHHLEGTLPSASEFRVYFYDNFTTPIDASFEAVAEVAPGDEKGKITALTEKLDLKNDACGNFLTATIPNCPLPLTIELRVKFSASRPAELFNFHFKKVTVDKPNAVNFDPKNWVPTQ
jgi:hypothetical protein